MKFLHYIFLLWIENIKIHKKLIFTERDKHKCLELMSLSFWQFFIWIAWKYIKKTFHKKI